MNKLKKLSIIVIIASIITLFLGVFLVNAVPPQKSGRTYTTGPLRSPPGTEYLDWMVLNNAPTTQTVKITIYELGIGDTKTSWQSSEWTLEAGETIHTSALADENVNFEVVVETSNKLVFPYVAFWDEYQENIAGSEVRSAEFIVQMP